ncbi:SH3 domain-containing protein [Leisingera sp. McT4-56]|uniref:SH3 domain-containing protein n=1 Tax=Leisingera sp. McT4-56 TaxID=2881255 RepID=UPI001CF8E379|nr:SH3 domain-containing protein [Leisingera sp. McT4-56]MCB4457478.1 SH3 domain-containing protein [Leisingera sp. McT4-56]
MSRFIFVSFAFLGWGFYELSGGTDFTPPERPEPVAAAEPAAQAPKPARITAASLAAQPVLTRRTEAPAPARPAADPNLRQRVAASHLVSASGVLASTQTAFSAAAEPAGLQLASLDGGLAAIAAAPAPLAPETAAAPASPAPETYIDRRSIRASRVNMRQGPGTNYPVIARLLGGEEVIVFEDSGTGWLHLRAPGKGKVGWIAASLVSKKRP